MPIDLQRVRALCFDVDGTLSDTDDQFVQKIESYLRIFNLIFPNKDMHDIARKIVMFSESPGNFLFGIPDKLNIDIELAAIGNYIYRKEHKKTGGFLLVPGVQEMLIKLSSHYVMSIVSARGERSTKLFLNQYNLNSFFKCIATAHTCKRTKPYPDQIIWSAKQMNVLPCECLMIGDTTVDIRAAKAAGAQSIGVLCGFGEEDELLKAGANLILPSTSLLVDIL